MFISLGGMSSSLALRQRGVSASGGIRLFDPSVEEVVLDAIQGEEDRAGE